MSEQHGQSAAPERALRVLVYSDDRTVRNAVILALGSRPAPELPAIEVLQCATQAAVIAAADQGGLDLMILDGEAVPAGGMGVCRQLKDEIYRCPPIIVLIARPQDGWLATWSRADAVAEQPVNPMALAGTAAELLRRRVGVVPAS